MSTKSRFEIVTKHPWQALYYSKWKDSLDTLHLWMQIVGKIKLQQNSFLNQWWEITFFVTANGMTTGAIPYKGNIFQIDFNFQEHTLTILTSWKKKTILDLKPQSVAEFYKEFMKALKKLDIVVSILPMPVEMSHSIPFTKDKIHCSYDKKYVERWWNILVNVTIVFEQFRTSFNGKSSPIHFFWGSFDLAGTRFSGKKLPDKTDWPKGYTFMRYAENEENFGFGFWPGDERFPHAGFYSYLYPQPENIDTMTFDNDISFNEQLRECVLPYEIVRKAKDPEKVIMHFLQSTYEINAKLAKWDISLFQAKIPLKSRH